MKVGEYIGQLLVKLGIKHYFAIPGDYNLALLDILHKNKKIEPVYCANELNMSRTDVQKNLITWGKNVGKYNKRKTKFYRT